MIEPLLLLILYYDYEFWILIEKECTTYRYFVACSYSYYIYIIIVVVQARQGSVRSNNALVRNVVRICCLLCVALVLGRLGFPSLLVYYTTVQQTEVLLYYNSTFVEQRNSSPESWYRCNRALDVSTLQKVQTKLKAVTLYSSGWLCWMLDSRRWWYRWHMQETPCLSWSPRGKKATIS